MQLTTGRPRMIFATTWRLFANGLLTFMKCYKSQILVYILLTCLLTGERIAVPHVYGKLLESIKNAEFATTTKVFGVLVAIYVVFQLIDFASILIHTKIVPEFESSCAQMGGAHGACS